jgi:hypothetical protein
MEDDLNSFFKEDNLNKFFKWKTTQNKIMEPRTIKSENNNIFEKGPKIIFEKKDDHKMQLKIIQSKNNDCGIALGNLVIIIMT